jgi:hypothetical protein
VVEEGPARGPRSYHNLIEHTPLPLLHSVLFLGDSLVHRLAARFNVESALAVRYHCTFLTQASLAYLYATGNHECAKIHVQTVPVAELFASVLKLHPGVKVITFNLGAHAPVHSVDWYEGAVENFASEMNRTRTAHPEVCFVPWADLDARDHVIERRFGPQRFVRNSYRIAMKNEVAKKVYARYGFPFLDILFDLSTVLHVHGHRKHDPVHFEKEIGRHWYNAALAYLVDEIKRICSRSREGEGRDMRPRTPPRN